jgi:hypothetical protein
MTKLGVATGKTGRETSEENLRVGHKPPETSRLVETRSIASTAVLTGCPQIKANY